nr:hypothetical protein I308_05593 [Cryptococcus tetragattii IND107]
MAKLLRLSMNVKSLCQRSTRRLILLPMIQNYLGLRQSSASQSSSQLDLFPNFDPQISSR